MSREPFLEFENYPSTNTPLSATNLNNMQLAIVDAINNNGGVMLLKSVLAAPTTFSTGDRYYDPDDDLIYTATSSSEWNEGDTPSNIVIYMNEEDTRLYRYSNNAMNQYSIYDDIYYKDGDTFTFDTLVVNGLITGGATNVQMSIPLPKRLTNISDATITNFTCRLRGIQGYLNSQSSAVNYATTSGYTITPTLRDNVITVSLVKSSAFTNATNNTPVAIYFDNIAITFNE